VKSRLECARCICRKLSTPKQRRYAGLAAFAILSAAMRKRIPVSLIPALLLIAGTLACATGAVPGGATATANFATATPGGSISISLLTPTMTQQGVPGFSSGQIIGPLATQTAQAQANVDATATAYALIPTATIPGIISQPETCPAPGTPTLSSEPPGFTRYASVIAEYLSNGGAATILEAGLRGWGAMTDQGGLVRADRDFTADGVPEVLVVAFDPQHIEDSPPPGDLFIFGCRDGAYRLLYQAGYAIDRGAPVLYSADDINGDRVNDVVYSVRTCGETRCDDEVHILEWSAPVENFTSLLAQDVIQPNADIVVSDVDADGLQEVSVTTGIIPLPEAGPQRQITSIYKWDGTLYTLSQTIKPIAEYRIHVIQDGDDDLLASNWADAITAYRKAISSDKLKSWTYPFEDEYLRAFARFRLMLTYVRAGNITAAQAAHDELIGVFSPTPLPPCDPAADPNCPPTPTPLFGPQPGIEFKQMADLFWGDYSVNRKLGQACNLVIGYARNNSGALDVLNSFGFANRQYTPPDMCPF